MAGPGAVGFVSAGSGGVRRGGGNWLRFGKGMPASWVRSPAGSSRSGIARRDVIGFVLSTALGSSLGSFFRPRPWVVGIAFPATISIDEGDDSGDCPELRFIFLPAIE